MPTRKRKLTITATEKIRSQLDQLTAENAPYLKRHRVLRAAVAIGLGAMIDNSDLLREFLISEQQEAAA